MALAPHIATLRGRLSNACVNTLLQCLPPDSDGGHSFIGSDSSTATSSSGAIHERDAAQERPGDAGSRVVQRGPHRTDGGTHCSIHVPFRDPALTQSRKPTLGWQRQCHQPQASSRVARHCPSSLMRTAPDQTRSTSSSVSSTTCCSNWVRYSSAYRPPAAINSACVPDCTTRPPSTTSI